MLPTVVPGTEASAREVKALGEAIARGGRAVYEAAEEGILDPEIREMWKTMSRDTGVPVSINMNDVQFDAEWMDEAWADGAQIHGQVFTKAVGMLFSLDASINVFSKRCPTFKELEDNLPLEERVAALKDPAIRAQVLQEYSARDVGGGLGGGVGGNIVNMYLLDKDSPDCKLASLSAFLRFLLLILGCCCALR